LDDRVVLAYGDRTANRKAGVLLDRVGRDEDREPAVRRSEVAPALRNVKVRNKGERGVLVVTAVAAAADGQGEEGGNGKGNDALVPSHALRTPAAITA
jgi:hypothetical protein